MNISVELTDWYNRHKRELPWRNEIDPYKIWVSEVILHQTRVAQGLDYYYRFINTLPTIQHLANATEDEVLHLWQGLGYYSRARNLQKAAREIVKNHNGIFPHQYEKIIKLSGIGPYSAAAIASFAFNSPYAVVDGNVQRVIARLFGISTLPDSSLGKKEFQSIANSLLDRQDPATHNQAIMEFGALLCTPQSPDCSQCPLSPICEAYLTGRIKNFPSRKPKTKSKIRYFHYLYIEDNAHTYIQKRTGNDIWKNMYEFPLVETDNQIAINELIQHPPLKLLRGNINPEITLIIEGIKHVLSHQTIITSLYKVKALGGEHIPPDYLRIKQNELYDYPHSRLISILIEKLEHTFAL